MVDYICPLEASADGVQSYVLSKIKKQQRQIQLESQRLQRQKSERMTSIAPILKKVESRVRSTQDAASKPLTSEELSSLKAKVEDISNLQKLVKRDLSVLRSLAFRSSFARHDAIPESHQETFSWVFSGNQENGSMQSGLVSWLESDECVFWVSGKPGAGKSTLMKFIADHSLAREALARWAAPKPVVVVSHYFWCAGTAMQRSHYGLLRTLLFEILRHFPDSISTWLPVLPASATKPDITWSIEDLDQALLKIIEQDCLPVKFCIFIDGLDEFDGDHLALCAQLMQLSKSGNAKLCLSSRPWDVFTRVFGHGVIPQLCLHDVTRRDIFSYVQNRLSQAPLADTLPEGVVGDLVNGITDKSQGVFLWVSLVTDLILEKSGVDPKADLQEALWQCPSDLDEFFTYMLSRVEGEAAPRMATSLLIAIEAERPLDIGVYYFHDMEYDDENYVLALGSDPPGRLEHRRQLADSKRKLEERCQKLLDTERKTNVVNFLHRTARDYLDQPETQKMLVSKAPAGFRPNPCLVKAFTAWLKTSRAAKAEEPRAEFISGAKCLLGAAARIQGTADDDTVRCLLDDLDQSLVDKGPSAEENLQLLRQEVIGHRLSFYLEDIINRTPNYFSCLQIPPLVTALDPGFSGEGKRDKRPQWDAATARTVSCLIESGHNPNTTFSTSETFAESGQKTPWLVLCENILPHHDDQAAGMSRTQSLLKSAMETGIFRSFLLSGADINAVCIRPGRSPSSVAIDYLFTSLAIDACDDEELQKLYLEYLDKFLAADYQHWNTAATDFLKRVKASRKKDTGEIVISSFSTLVVQKLCLVLRNNAQALRQTTMPAIYDGG